MPGTYRQVNPSSTRFRIIFVRRGKSATLSYVFVNGDAPNRGLYAPGSPIPGSPKNLSTGNQVFAREFRRGVSSDSSMVGDMHRIAIGLAIASILAPIGALMAGIITYIEYAKHGLENGRALREAFVTGSLALLLLTGCALATALLL